MQMGDAGNTSLRGPRSHFQMEREIGCGSESWDWYFEGNEVEQL
jgi:hypothetical protein